MDTFNFSYFDCKWTINEDWLLYIKLPEKPKTFSSFEPIVQIGSSSKGKYQEETNIDVYKITTTPSALSEDNVTYMFRAQYLKVKENYNKTVFDIVRQKQALKRETSKYAVQMFFAYVYYVFFAYNYYVNYITKCYLAC